MPQPKGILIFSFTTQVANRRLRHSAKAFTPSSSRLRNSNFSNFPARISIREQPILVTAFYNPCALL